MKKAFIPTRAKQDAKFQLKDFLGVDFSTHESEVANRRSPDSVNMITGFQGSIDKRLGSKINHKYSGKINSINKVSYYYRRYEEFYWYNPSTESWNLSNRYWNADKEFVVVHEGTRVQLGNIVNGEYVHIAQITSLTPTGFSAQAMNLSDVKTRLLRINQFTYILMGAGIFCVIGFIHGNNIDGIDTGLGLEGNVTGLSWSIASGDTNESVPTIWAYMQDIRSIPMAQSKFKTPVINIAKTPNGVTKTSFEDKSILNAFVSEKFKGDGTSVIYKLDEALVTKSTDKDYNGFTLPFYNATTDACVRIMIKNASGVWVAYSGTYVVTDSKTLTLSTAPAVPTISGDDNVEITYLRYIWNPSGDSSWGSVRLLSRLTEFEYFGYNGNFDYAFVAYGWDGDFGKLNKDYRIKLDDDLANVHMYENSFSYLGNSDSAIMGYFRYQSNLVTVTKKTTNNTTIFIRSASLDAQGEVIFPIITGGEIGALSSYSFDSLRGDDMWLSEYGINALTTNNLTAKNSVQDRGFYINKQLLEEANLDKAVGFVYDNKYWLCINNHTYVADSRMKSFEKNAFSEQFQYDWAYFDGLDIQAYLVEDTTLFFGTTDGRIMRLKFSTDTHAYEDEIIGTETTWANETNYVVGQLVKDSGTPTKYYICLKAHTSDLTVRSLTNETYWNEITKGTDRFYVPILAYWTTPIMNMNNITAKKTLRNLWVRLPKYAFTGVRIYYSSKGLVKKQYDGIFDFSTLDFSRLSFSTDTDPMVVVTNTKQSKFMSIQFKIESRDNTPMSLLEIVGEYTTNGKYKG